MTLFDLVKKLVNIPSVTGREGEIGDFLSRYLEEQGFAVQEQKIDERRKNILAVVGQRPGILLCTHMDTVPPFFGASEDESFIYGRGACDAKGIMASMIWAARDLMEQGVAEIGLLFVVGEETDSIGAKTANALDMQPDFIIFGEPTENKLGSGHRGNVTVKIAAKGKTAHSASPHRGESAIERLLDILQTIRGLDFGDDPVMGRSFLNIGTIEGGVAPNVVASSACAEISIRSVCPAEHVIDKLKALASREVEFHILTQSEPQILLTIPGFDQVFLPYGTDIPHLRKFGRALLIGPGSFLDAHTENEKIEKGRLLEAVDIYKTLVKKLLFGY